MNTQDDTEAEAFRTRDEHSTQDSTSGLDAVRRRRVLQAAGAAGAGAALFSGPAVSSTGGQEYVGSVQFVEAGLAHETSAFSPTAHVDQFPSYRVDPSAGELELLVPGVNAELFGTSELVVNGDAFRDASSGVYDAQTARSIPLSLTRSLDRHRVLILNETYAIPELALESRSRDGLRATAGSGTAVEMGPAETTELRLEPRRVENHAGDEGAVTPVWTVRNHGTVDVYVNTTGGNR